MTSPTLYLDRLMAGVRAALSSVPAFVAPLAANPAGASILWAPAERPRELTAGLLVLLSIIAGPSWDGTVPGGYAYQFPQTATITCTGAAGQMLVKGTGARWAVVGSGDAETDRDALLSALTAPGKQLFASPTASGSDAITLTASDVKALWGLSVEGPLSLTIGSYALAAVTSHDEIVRVGIQAFSTSRYPYGFDGDVMSAHQAMTEVINATASESFTETLEEYGIALAGPPTPPADLTAISGAGWESRSAANIDLRMRALSAEAVDDIASVDFTLSERTLPESASLTVEDA